MDRTKGHVIGEDDGVFKVRVQGGIFGGKKLRVVSTHENCRLAPRLDVDFIIATSQGRDEQFPVAVDVRPVVATTKCDAHPCGEDAEILMEVSGSASEAAYYVRTCLPHLPQRLKDASVMHVFGRRVIKVINVARGDKEWRTLVGIC